MSKVTEICIHAFKREADVDGTLMDVCCDEHDADKAGYSVYERCEQDDPRMGGFDIQNEVDFVGDDASERAFALATSLAERHGVPIDEY